MGYKLKKYIESFKCLKCKYFYYYLILCLSIILIFSDKVWKWLSNNTDQFQAIGAIANVFLVGLIYFWSKKDKRKDNIDEQKLKWFLENLLPDFKKEFNNILNVAKNEIKNNLVKLDNTSKQSQKIKRMKTAQEKINKVIVDASYKEIEAINKFYYYDSDLTKLLRDEIESFYDELINLVSNIENIDAFPDILHSISEHKNVTMKIIFTSIIDKK